MRSKLEPIKKFVRTIRNHEELIFNYWEAKKEFTSGVVEGLNRKVNLVTRKAYGFQSGTGFAIERGLVATAHHVVAAGHRLVVRDGQGNTHEASYLISADPQVDLAVIKVPSLRVKALPLSPYRVIVSPDAPLTIIGRRNVDTPTVIEGEMKELIWRDFGDRRIPLYQIKAHVWPGCSGAPVLTNDRQQVVAILIEKVRNSPSCIATTTDLITRAVDQGEVEHLPAWAKREKE